MSNDASEPIDKQREAQALNLSGGDPWRAIPLAAQLAREGWTPPPRDPWKAEVEAIAAQFGVTPSEQSVRRLIRASLERGVLLRGSGNLIYDLATDTMVPPPS